MDGWVDVSEIRVNIDVSVVHVYIVCVSMLSVYLVCCVYLVCTWYDVCMQVCASLWCVCVCVCALVQMTADLAFP